MQKSKIGALTRYIIGNNLKENWSSLAPFYELSDSTYKIRYHTPSPGGIVLFNGLILVY